MLREQRLYNSELSEPRGGGGRFWQINSPYLNQGADYDLHIITCLASPLQIFRHSCGHVALVYGSFVKYGKSSEKSLQMSQLYNLC